MKKNIVKFHSYKNKLNWQSFLNGLKLGYSNKIKFIKLYKMEKYSENQAVEPLLARHFLIRKMKQ